MKQDSRHDKDHTHKIMFVLHILFSNYLVNMLRQFSNATLFFLDNIFVRTNGQADWFNLTKVHSVRHRNLL